MFSSRLDTTYNRLTPVPLLPSQLWFVSNRNNKPLFKGISEVKCVTLSLFFTRLMSTVQNPCPHQSQHVCRDGKEWIRMGMNYSLTFRSESCFKPFTVQAKLELVDVPENNESHCCQPHPYLVIFLKSASQQHHTTTRKSSLLVLIVHCFQRIFHSCYGENHTMWRCSTDSTPGKEQHFFHVCKFKEVLSTLGHALCLLSKAIELFFGASSWIRKQGNQDVLQINGGSNK